MTTTAITGSRRTAKGVWVRAMRLVAMAIVIGVPLSQIVVYSTDFFPVDISSYLWAGEAWRTTGNPYAEAPLIVNDNPIYRYAPWFAVPWMALSLLPTQVVEYMWVAVMILCATLAVVPLFRSFGWRAFPVGGFFFGWLVAIGLNGNVQPALIAVLAWGLNRRWGPAAIAIAASLKAVPILYVLVYVGRGEWRKVAFTIAMAVALVAPMLLFKIPDVNTAAGTSYSLYGISPVLWGLIAIACAAIAVALARTRYGWLAAGTTVLMALPRTFIYDITFLLPGLSERRGSDLRSNDAQAVRSGRDLAADPQL